MSSPMMTSSPNKFIISKEISEEDEIEDELSKKLAHYTLEGNWHEVRKMYESKPKAHTITVNSSEDTALHVAVDLDEEEVVKDLVHEIVAHMTGALEKGNEHGDTPLHNKKGETPLFLAALNCYKEAFAYLHHTHQSLPITLPELVRDHDGDTILHCAIRREYFDLAVIILHYFGELATLSNNKGLTPLKVLATRPLAFPSGIKFSWWKLILYHCKFFLNWGSDDKVDEENPSEKYDGFFPPNCAVICQSIKTADVYSFGVSGQVLNKVRKTKKNHQWSNQLLKTLMKNASEAFTGTGAGGKPSDDWKGDFYEINDAFTQRQNPPKAALEEQSWTIGNSTLQMMWDTKWHEYIRGIMPEENYLRINHHRKTAKQIFIESHRDLIENSITELKETSVACSAVAGIIASVAFASTSSTSGGGGNGSDNKGLEVGKLESDTLAVASLVGLCFSVSSIITFLSLYNSLKQADDFRRSLPLKLLLGLIFLFLSVVAMIISFSSGQYSLLSHHGRSFLIPLYAATFFPLCLFVVVQIPRCFDILKTIISSQLP
ncbi:NF-kappa-B inhibitor cactus [Arachis hypogaea]|nr:NF-kappa-B inhibitor cactus [Arachis hypogaea]